MPIQYSHQGPYKGTEGGKYNITPLRSKSCDCGVIHDVSYIPPNTNFIWNDNACFRTTWEETFSYKPVQLPERHWSGPGKYKFEILFVTKKKFYGDDLKAFFNFYEENSEYLHICCIPGSELVESFLPKESQPARGPVILSGIDYLLGENRQEVAPNYAPPVLMFDWNSANAGVSNTAPSLWTSQTSINTYTHTVEFYQGSASYKPENLQQFIRYDQGVAIESAVQFDSDDYLASSQTSNNIGNSADFLGSGTLDLFIVAEPSSGNANNNLISFFSDSASAGSGFSLQAVSGTSHAGQINFSGSGTNQSYNFSYDNVEPGPSIYSLSISNSRERFSFSINGQYITGGSGTIPYEGYYRLGSGFEGKIYQIVGIPDFKDSSSAEINGVLAQRWGITNKLPTGSPYYEPKSFALLISGEENFNITREPSHLIYSRIRSGELATIKISPKRGIQFLDLSGEGLINGPITEKRTAQDNFTFDSTEREFNFLVTGDTFFDLSYQNLPEYDLNISGSGVQEGSGTYFSGEIISISTSTSHEQHERKFVEWESGTVDDSYNVNTNITLTGDTTLNAKYRAKQYYNVILRGEGQQSGAGSFYEDTEISITGHRPLYKHFDYWEVTSGSHSLNYEKIETKGARIIRYNYGPSQNPTTFKITGDLEITANYAITPRRLFVDQSPLQNNKISGINQDGSLFDVTSRNFTGTEIVDLTGILVEEGYTHGYWSSGQDNYVTGNTDPSYEELTPWIMSKSYHTGDSVRVQVGDGNLYVKHTFYKEKNFSYEILYPGHTGLQSNYPINYSGSPTGSFAPGTIVSYDFSGENIDTMLYNTVQDPSLHYASGGTDFGLCYNILSNGFAYDGEVVHREWIGWFNGDNNQYFMPRSDFDLYCKKDISYLGSESGNIFYAPYARDSMDGHNSFRLSLSQQIIFGGLLPGLAFYDGTGVYLDQAFNDMQKEIYTRTSNIYLKGIEQPWWGYRLGTSTIPSATNLVINSGEENYTLISFPSRLSVDNLNVPSIDESHYNLNIKYPEKFGLADSRYFLENDFFVKRRVGSRRYNTSSFSVSPSVYITPAHFFPKQNRNAFKIYNATDLTVFKHRINGLSAFYGPQYDIHKNLSYNGIYDIQSDSFKNYLIKPSMSTNPFLQEVVSLQAANSKANFFGVGYLPFNVSPVNLDRHNRKKLGSFIDAVPEVRDMGPYPPYVWRKADYKKYVFDYNLPYHPGGVPLGGSEEYFSNENIYKNLLFSTIIEYKKDTHPNLYFLLNIAPLVSKHKVIDSVSHAARPFDWYRGISDKYIKDLSLYQRSPRNYNLSYNLFRNYSKLGSPENPPKNYHSCFLGRLDWQEYLKLIDNKDFDGAFFDCLNHKIFVGKKDCESYGFKLNFDFEKITDSNENGNIEYKISAHISTPDQSAGVKLLEDLNHNAIQGVFSAFSVDWKIKDMISFQISDKEHTIEGTHHTSPWNQKQLPIAPPSFTKTDMDFGIKNVFFGPANQNTNLNLKILKKGQNLISKSLNNFKLNNNLEIQCVHKKLSTGSYPNKRDVIKLDKIPLMHYFPLKNDLYWFCGERPKEYNKDAPTNKQLRVFIYGKHQTEIVYPPYFSQGQTTKLGIDSPNGHAFSRYRAIGKGFRSNIGFFEFTDQTITLDDFISSDTEFVIDGSNSTLQSREILKLGSQEFQNQFGTKWMSHLTKLDFNHEILAFVHGHRGYLLNSTIKSDFYKFSRQSSFNDFTVESVKKTGKLPVIHPLQIEGRPIKRKMYLRKRNEYNQMQEYWSTQGLTLYDFPESYIRITETGYEYREENLIKIESFSCKLLQNNIKENAFDSLSYSAPYTAAVPNWTSTDSEDIEDATFLFVRDTSRKFFNIARVMQNNEQKFIGKSYFVDNVGNMALEWDTSKFSDANIATTNFENHNTLALTELMHSKSDEDFSEYKLFESAEIFSKIELADEVHNTSNVFSRANSSLFAKNTKLYSARDHRNRSLEGNRFYSALVKDNAYLPFEFSEESDLISESQIRKKGELINPKVKNLRLDYFENSETIRNIYKLTSALLGHQDRSKIHAALGTFVDHTTSTSVLDDANENFTDVTFGSNDIHLEIIYDE